MGNGIGIPNDKGTINAVPDRLDVYHAKELAGSRWDSELFECLAEPQTGTISREQFLLAPLLDRRMLLEAVRITREDVGEGETPNGTRSVRHCLLKTITTIRNIFLLVTRKHRRTLLTISTWNFSALLKQEGLHQQLETH